MYFKCGRKSQLSQLQIYKAETKCLSLQRATRLDCNVPGRCWKLKIHMEKEPPLWLVLQVHWEVLLIDKGVAVIIIKMLTLALTWRTYLLINTIWAQDQLRPYLELEVWDQSSGILTRAVLPQRTHSVEMPAVPGSHIPQEPLGWANPAGPSAPPPEMLSTPSFGLN